jgi:hypothetical protein
MVTKTSGPHGFLGEFYKAFKEILILDLLSVFNSITLQPMQTLKSLNDSYIIMIPKK